MAEPAAINYTVQNCISKIMREGVCSTYLVDVLATELREELVETLIVSLDTDSTKNLLDVCGGRRGLATDLEEEVCGDVTHLQLFKSPSVHAHFQTRNKHIL